MQHTSRNTPSIFFICAASVILAGCGGSSGGGGSSASTVYSTTSNKGDYSEWTLDGDTLTTSWQEINILGEISVTYDITADCGAENASGIRSCTISTASCSDGIDVCGTLPSGTIEVMSVPGVALFATTPATTSSDDQLHVGFAKDSGACADDVSGDYTYIRTGLSLDENFGVFRSDSNFVNVAHADFGFDTPDNNATTQTVGYRTNVESEMFTDMGCVDGVRTRQTAGATIRGMLTSGGLFMLDLPSGDGGLIAFDATNAASIADFANASWGGISFPDNSGPEALSATSGVATDGRVTVNVSFAGGGSDSIRLMALGTADNETAPAYPDFTSTTDPAAYSSAVLHTTYPSMADIPGLFKGDDSPDEGRIIIAATKIGGKVVGIGMVYNSRDMTDIDLSVPGGATTFAADGLYNTGNFIIFQR